MKMRTFGFCVMMLVGCAGAQAALVSSWGLETGAQNATLTEGSAGSFSTTTPTGNATPRALLSSPVSFANVGDSVVLSGNVTLQNAPGNQQFRFGLYNTNGKATGTLSGGLWSGADNTGWLGYMVEIGGGGGNDTTVGRTTSGAWFSGTGAYLVGNGPGGATSPPAATPYSFVLTLTRTGATAVNVAYTFGDGASVIRTGNFTDNNLGASAAVPSFNAVGFLTNANTGSAQFSNVDVSVPEPVASMLALLAAPAMLAARRRWTHARQ